MAPDSIVPTPPLYYTVKRANLTSRYYAAQAIFVPPPNPFGEWNCVATLLGGSSSSSPRCRAQSPRSPFTFVAYLGCVFAQTFFRVPLGRESLSSCASRFEKIEKYLALHCIHYHSIRVLVLLLKHQVNFLVKFLIPSFILQPSLATMIQRPTRPPWSPSSGSWPIKTRSLSSTSSRSTRRRSKQTTEA